ncbi:hypothetical protein IWZ03DRAFT_212051 [Phyllosticta citriasiana]|uniref:Secreted protein n=1 Tax=Phyllosticta citriasiana TaxID=595635 RepID=A0ABR1KP68_9PEZI
MKHALSMVWLSMRFSVVQIAGRVPCINKCTIDGPERGACLFLCFPCLVFRLSERCDRRQGKRDRRMNQDNGATRQGKTEAIGGTRGYETNRITDMSTAWQTMAKWASVHSAPCHGVHICRSSSATATS